jgi:hypothetical protein
MFVPVSCTNCGKPFQVAESALGTLVACPWCQSVVSALPVAGSQPVPPAPYPQQVLLSTAEPLSLDDDDPPPARIEPPLGSPARFWVTPATVLIAGFVVLAGMSLVVLYRGYGAGRISELGWTEFAPPDGSFSVALPGEPTEEDVPANPAGSVTGGKRYAVRGRYSKTTVWVAYADLSPALVAQLPADKDRVITAGVLRVERYSEVSRLKATASKEAAEVRVGSAWGAELHMDTPEGNVIEWLILVGSGPHPRLYTFGVEGKNVTRASPACAKLFNTFRVVE